MYTNKYIYLPSTDQKLEEGVESNAETRVSEKAPYIRLYPNKGQDLGRVRTGDCLLVVGHGNLGKGIGTHNEFFGANKLAAKMKKEGLWDEAFTIKLFSCNTAVTMPGFKAPYVKRLSNALYDLGYRQPKLQGYVGFAFLTNHGSNKRTVEEAKITFKGAQPPTAGAQLAKKKRTTWKLEGGVHQSDGGEYKMVSSIEFSKLAKWYRLQELKGAED
jgi:hypothetical protein